MFIPVVCRTFQWRPVSDGIARAPVSNPPRMGAGPNAVPQRGARRRDLGARCPPCLGFATALKSRTVDVCSPGYGDGRLQKYSPKRGRAHERHRRAKARSAASRGRPLSSANGGLHLPGLGLTHRFQRSGFERSCDQAACVSGGTCCKATHARKRACVHVVGEPRAESKKGGKRESGRGETGGGGSR